MKAITLVFPHQLFNANPAVNKSREIYIVEELLFFRQYKFHKQKLVFHRASMKFYENYLREREFIVHYIESHSKLSDIRNFVNNFSVKGVKEIHVCDVTDNWLSRRLNNVCLKRGIKITEYETPLFLNTKNFNEDYFKGRKQFYQTDFYINQRKRLNILVENGNKPKGGRWSFDAENRKKYPKDKKPPTIKYYCDNAYVAEGKKYVNRHFPDNYGDIENDLQFPVTYNDSKKWFKDFLQNRFEEFGMYEDAILKREGLLNHSGISPMLNTGLLSPKYIIDETLEYAKKNNIPLNSVEGFIRQIIGWREFIRAVYELKGSEERAKNFWGFKRKMPASFWGGTTGIEPVDDAIKKVLKTGYCHHIERLMVLGNFMVLCEFCPDDVYRWFMEMFVDAYNWVMVPNVYGMSQFADGGIMSTKPYISGSNYLMKMSNFSKGEWQNVWDALFWNFMNKHRSFFLKNPRLGMLVKTFDKMASEKRAGLINTAEKYIKSL